MAEPARPRARDPVGPHPYPTPTGALSALGDLQRRLLPPSGAHALLGPQALGTAAAGLDPGRAGLLCAGEWPPDAADRLDAAPRPLQKPLDHAAARGPGGAARLLAGPPGHGRGRHPAGAGRSSPHPVAWLAAGTPPRPVDRRPRLSRARPEALPEAAAVPVHPPGDRGYHGPDPGRVGAAAGGGAGAGAAAAVGAGALWQGEAPGAADREPGGRPASAARAEASPDEQGEENPPDGGRNDLVPGDRLAVVDGRRGALPNPDANRGELPGQQRAAGAGARKNPAAVDPVADAAVGADDRLHPGPATGGRGAGGGPAPAAGRPAWRGGAAGGEAGVPGAERHPGRAACAGAAALPGRHPAGGGVPRHGGEVGADAGPPPGATPASADPGLAPSHPTRHESCSRLRNVLPPAPWPPLPKTTGRGGAN